MLYTNFLANSHFLLFQTELKAQYICLFNFIVIKIFTESRYACYLLSQSQSL